MMERIGVPKFVVCAEWVESFWSDGYVEYQVVKEIRIRGQSRGDWTQRTLVLKTKLYEHAIGLRDKLVEGGVE